MTKYKVNYYDLIISGVLIILLIVLVIHIGLTFVFAKIVSVFKSIKLFKGD